MSLITIEFPGGSDGPRTPDRVLDQHTHLIRRFFAGAVDYGGLLIVAAFAAYHFGIVESDGKTTHYSLSLAEDLIFLILYVIYFSVFEALVGRTLGKWVFDLAVVTRTGARPSIFASIKRHMLDPVDSCMCFIPALVVVKVSPSRQRLGDMFAGTWVVSSVPPCSVLRGAPRDPSSVIPARSEEHHDA